MKKKYKIGFLVLSVIVVVLSCFSVYQNYKIDKIEERFNNNDYMWSIQISINEKQSKINQDIIDILEILV